jgi:chromosome segregation ATPase
LQTSGNVAGLQSKLDNQLKDAYKDISTYRAQAEQLSRDLRAERSRREKAERDLSVSQDSVEVLRSDLAESRQENGNLSNLHAAGGNSDLITQLKEAQYESDRAYRERDRALDKIQDLEDECMRLEKLAAPAQKADVMQREIAELNSKKIEMMQDMIDEEARHLDEAGGKIAGLEHERDEAMVQVARLQTLVKELRNDTRHLSRSNSRRNSSASPHAGRDWAGRNAYATEALVQAALRMTQIETENERLRVQLQSRYESSTQGLKDKETMQALRERLSFAEQERETVQFQLESRGQPQYNQQGDAHMIQVLKAKQKELSSMKTAAANLKEFTLEVQQSKGSYSQEADTVLVDYHTDLDRIDTLPQGWERMLTTDEVEYFVDHNTQNTQWTHPLHDQQGGYIMHSPTAQPAASNTSIGINASGSSGFAHSNTSIGSAGTSTSRKLAKYQSRNQTVA